MTEFGVADLYAKGVRERAKALIAIADPRFREELEREAFGMKLLTRKFAKPA